MDTREQEIIIELLADNELAAAGLYRAFSKYVPRYTDLWGSLSKEKRSHMEWLQELKNGLEPGALSVSEGRFNRAKIAGLAKRILDHALSVKGPEYSAEWAFEIGQEIEMAFLEGRFFEVLAQDSKKVKDVFIRMNKSIKENEQKVRQEFGRFRAARE